jgi:RNA polymerase sigma factor (sigma-70 family)
MNNPSQTLFARHPHGTPYGQRDGEQAVSPGIAAVSSSIPGRVSGVRVPAAESFDGAVSPVATVTYESLFLAHLDLIERLIRNACRRHRLDSSNAEDFASDVRLHLVKNDNGVLRQYRERSSLQTYLLVVIERVFLDFRVRHWGKWRPSAGAMRLGDLAVLLERLLTRDGWTFEQALTILQTNYQMTVNRQDLDELCRKLPDRPPRRQFVGEQNAENVPSGRESPDSTIENAQREFRLRQVRAALRRAVEELGPDDRLILRLRFRESLTVAQIAKMLHMDQKRLYRRCDRLLDRLRKSLQGEGFNMLDIGESFSDPDEGAPGRQQVGNVNRRPSTL